MTTRSKKGWNELSRCAACVLPMLCISGCTTPTPVRSQSLLVPVKVFAITGDGQTLGSRFNDWCRFNETEINQIVDQLIANSAVYASYTRFERTQPNPIVVEDLNSFTFGYERNPTFNDFYFLAQVNPDIQPDAGAINIYFTGNLGNPPGSQQLIRGASVNPRDTNSAGLNFIIGPGAIFVNDGGGDGGDADLATTLSLLVAEHEVGHYLDNGSWQRAFQPYGQNNREYDSMGHLHRINFAPAPVGAPYLMVPGDLILGQQGALNIPGKEVDVSTGLSGDDELEVTSFRVQTGFFNQP